MNALTIQVASKTYAAEDGSRPNPVFRDFSLDVAAGSLLAILGPSGCGKTTLLNIVAGLDRDFDGKAFWHGPSHAGRAKIGYVFQQPTLLPWRKVRDNLRLVMSPEQIERRLDDSWLDAMGLSAHAHCFPNELSMGMSRRVALARAFVVEPDLLLMDEPFVSLDEETAQDLRWLLYETWQRKPTTVLFVTHDSREAFQLAQRVVLLSSSPAEIIHDQSVALSRAERADPRRIDALRQTLKQVAGCSHRALHRSSQERAEASRTEP